MKPHANFGWCRKSAQQKWLLKQSLYDTFFFCFSVMFLSFKTPVPVTLKDLGASHYTVSGSSGIKPSSFDIITRLLYLAYGIRTKLCENWGTNPWNAMSFLLWGLRKNLKSHSGFWWSTHLNNKNFCRKSSKFMGISTPVPKEHLTEGLLFSSMGLNQTPKCCYVTAWHHCCMLSKY